MGGVVFNGKGPQGDYPVQKAGRRGTCLLTEFQLEFEIIFLLSEYMTETAVKTFQTYNVGLVNRGNTPDCPSMIISWAFTVISWLLEFNSQLNIEREIKCYFAFLLTWL